MEETQPEFNAYQEVSATVVNTENQNFVASPNDVSSSSRLMHSNF